jgi:hypothetical protein
MKYKIRNTDWAKRRVGTPHPEIEKVEVPNLKKEKNYFCDMIVTYKSGEIKTYPSRVIQNQIKKTWCLDGMHVVIDIIEF